MRHSLFTLAAPNRIVIDVSGAQLATQLNGLKLGNTPITAVRSAQRTPNDLRMVLDLSAQVTPASSCRPTSNTATAWWSISTTRALT